MRSLWVAGIALVLFCIGIGFYAEIEKARFTKSLPQVPNAAEQPADVSVDVSLEVEERTTDAQEGKSGTVPPTRRTVDDYDWRNDAAPAEDHRHSHDNLWEQFHAADDDENGAENGEQIVWFHIADPYERAEAYRAQLIQQFGEREEIDVLAELKPKVWQELPMTLDEVIRHAEAQMGLWPTEHTREAIEEFKKWRADGREVVFNSGNSSSHLTSDSNMDAFDDAKAFVTQYGQEEGIRKFRASHPERAAELKRQLLREVERGNVALELVDRLFPDTDASQPENLVP